VGTRRHAIAVNIVTVDDDVAEVYANPKFDPLIDTYPTVPLAHATLHFNGASNMGGSPRLKLRR
jgi:hypothetical protein